MRILSPLPCPLLFHCPMHCRPQYAVYDPYDVSDGACWLPIGRPLAGQRPTVWVSLIGCDCPPHRPQFVKFQTRVSKPPRKPPHCGAILVVVALFFANIDFRSSHRAPSNCMRPRHWLETIVNGSFFFYGCCCNWQFRLRACARLLPRPPPCGCRGRPLYNSPMSHLKFQPFITSP